MSLSFFARRLYYGEETTYGTSVTPNKVFGIASSFSSGGDVVVEDVRAGDRGYYKRVLLGLDFAPKIEFKPLTGEFLKYVLGKVTNTGSAAPYTHTIEVGNSLKSLTVEAARIGPSSIAERVVGLLVSGCEISFENNGLVEVSLDAVAKNVSVVSPYTDPALSIPAKEPFTFNDATLTIGSTQYAYVVSGSISINNTLEPLPRGSDGTVKGYALAECEYEASFDLFFDNASLLSDFLNKTRRNVTVRFSRTANDYIEFSFTNAVIKVESELPFQEGEIMQSVSIYPESMTVTVKDDIATY